MSVFRERLAQADRDPSGRRWLYVPYDQLSDAIGPLARENPRELGIILIENRWKAARRPYHQQKLALVLTNQRHFALEQAERGVAVRYEVADSPYRDALAPLIDELGALQTMLPAERELRADLEPLVKSGGIELIPHEGWLTTREQFEASQGGPPWRMDAFYRQARRDSGILMEEGKPRGGKFSFDRENRESWRGEPSPPEPPEFSVDEITAEVGELIRQSFSHHPGQLRLEAVPASREDARRLWSWGKRECLPHFGPYQDAMSTRSRTLFHTLISGLLNLHRLLPAQVIDEALEVEAPLASLEGFVRQILGWREFVRHVHELTDGFRQLPVASEPERAAEPGDGGWQRWAAAPWERAEAPAELDGGAAPSELDARAPLPIAYWGQASGLACLDQVVAEVWDTGYGHHITRLMVLSNIATLLGVSPRELTDWFWVAYSDAYDWVVEPNVLGMGTFAVGELMTTKPYVSGAAYVQRMSDYCASCQFDPRASCPLTHLYWAFLARNRQVLAGNARLRLPLASLDRRGEERRKLDQAVFGWVSDRLRRGEALQPEDAPEESD